MMKVNILYKNATSTRSALQLAHGNNPPYNASMTSTFFTRKKILRLFLILALLAMLTTWLVLTPEGLEGKLHAVGFAICHQIPSHTLSIGNKLLPLCARCTGMFLGTLLAMIALLSNEKKTKSPPQKVQYALATLLVFFIVDGVNSTLPMIPTLKPVYEPQNSLRLITGFCMGIVLAVLLVTLWNQTLWTDTKAESILSSWKQLFSIFLIEIIAGILIWLNIPILYFPVAILSIGTILLILSMVYTMLWIIILNKENSIEKFSKGVNFYLLGLLTALLQIGIMDILRYSVFGSWFGVQF